MWRRRKLGFKTVADGVKKICRLCSDGGWREAKGDDLRFYLLRCA